MSNKTALREIYAYLKLSAENARPAAQLSERHLDLAALLAHQHSNIVNLLEIFKDGDKICLVFECLDHTVLQDIDVTPEGLPRDRVCKFMYQVLRAVAFMHADAPAGAASEGGTRNHFVHRDIKPENLLISKNGILKLCDFGFSRQVAASGKAALALTDYVSTRWYRAPEL